MALKLGLSDLAMVVEKVTLKNPSYISYKQTLFANFGAPPCDGMAHRQLTCQNTGAHCVRRLDGVAFLFLSKFQAFMSPLSF